MVKKFKLYNCGTSPKAEPSQAMTIIISSGKISIMGRRKNDWQGFGYDTGADDAKLNGFFWQDNSQTSYFPIKMGRLR